MIIQNKIVLVYDIEVFPNVFSCTIKNTENQKIKAFEISERKNELPELLKIFKWKGYLFCGYNCIHYDNPIMNFLLAKEMDFQNESYMQICAEIFNLSDTIINTDNKEAWKQWKYAKNFATLDLLTMLFSEKLRVGLKEMQVTMRFHNVQEYDGDFNKYLPANKIDEMLYYNKNDVESTEELLYRCEKDVKLRLGIQEEYGLDVLSMDGVSIGKEILKTKYLQDTGKSWWDIKDLRSPCDHVRLKDVLLEKFSFDDPLLKALLAEMKTLTVSPGIKGWNKHFLFHGKELSIGVGGLHSINNSEYYIADDDYVLLDVDAASLYPSLLIEYGFYPKHLGVEFVKTYSNIKSERIEAKHNGNDVKNMTLKLALNAVTGLMQSEYSWMYSPQDVMRIRMNGQLFLLKLAEMLYAKLDCDIFNWNTDGLFVKLKRTDLDTYYQIIKEFEQFSKLSMETEFFEAMFQVSVNDYIAVHDGYSQTHDRKLIKQKGSFIEKVSLGKGMQPPIIPKALIDYFVNHIPVATTVYNSKDINDFITYQKVGKQFSVEYNGQLITRINRYYVALNAPYLFKCKVNSETGLRTGYENMLCASGVKIVNDLKNVVEFPKDINYRYYVGEAQKVIDGFEKKQLTLF